MAANNYKSLITQVVLDFDEIYTALRNKGAKYNNNALAVSGNTGIPTSAYANIIASELFKVAEKNGVAPTIGSTQIANKTGAVTDSGITTSVNYTNKTVSISGLSAGYYDGSSVLSSTLGEGEFVDASISSFVKGEDGNYTLTPTNGNIVSSVTLAGGKVELDASGKLIAGQGEDLPTISAQHTLTGTGIVISPSAIAGGYEITLECNATASGKIKSNISDTAGLSLTEGYVKASDLTIVNGEYDLSGVSTGTSTTKYYVNKGTIALKSVTASGAVSIGGLKAGTAENGYAVSATVAKPVIKADQVAGYVAVTGEVDLSPTTWDETAADTKYIAKGSLPTLNQAPTTAVTAPEGNIGTVSNNAPLQGSTDYTFSVTTEEASVTVTPEEGYVKSTDVGTVNLTPAATKYISIAHGSANASVNALTASATSDYLAASGKEFTVDLSASVTKSVTPGYVKEADVTVSGKTAQQKFYVKEGSLSATNTLGITAVNKDTTLKDPEVGTFFSTTAPADTDTRDWFKLQASAALSLTAGWIDSVTTPVTTQEYYIPRATFNYVEDSESGASFIQVKQAGFIEAGNIQAIEGEIDYAEVKVGVTYGDIADGSSLAAGSYYSVALTKGEVNAGYIGSNNGSVSGEVKVKKGTVATSSSISAITPTGKVTYVGAGDGGTAKYTLDVTAKSDVITTVSEGYVKGTAADLSVNGEGVASATKKELVSNSTLELDAGAVEVRASDLVGSAVASSNMQTAQSSKYVVTPKLTGAAEGSTSAELSVSVSKAGYIDENYSDKVNVQFNAENSAPVYIKEGVKLESVNGSGTVAVKHNLADTVDGEYTISLASADQKIAVNGELQEGYYGAAEKAVSGNATVTGLTGQLTIAHGSVSATSVSTSIGVDSADVVLHDNVGEANLNKYYEITPTISGLTVGLSTTQGYVKEADVKQTATAVTNTNTTKTYVAKYIESTTTVKVGEETCYDAFTSGFGVVDNEHVDTMVIDTEHKYVDKKIAVQLHPDAAGSAVRDELDLLAERLAGNNVSVVALA